MREPTVSESIRINAAPEVVYDLVADVARMGEWSPEATGARMSNVGPVGRRRYLHRNKQTRHCPVVDELHRDAGRARKQFEFTVEVKPFKISTWRYEFVADGEATVVEPNNGSTTGQAFVERPSDLGQALIPAPAPITTDGICKPRSRTSSALPKPSSPRGGHRECPLGSGAVVLDLAITRRASARRRRPLQPQLDGRAIQTSMVSPLRFL